MSNENEQALQCEPAVHISAPIPAGLEPSVRAFLSKFTAGVQVEMSKLPGVLRALTDINEVPEFTERAYEFNLERLKRLAAGDIKNGAAKDLMARLLGYKHHLEVATSARINGRIMNLRHGSDAEILPQAMVSLKRTQSVLDKTENAKTAKRDRGMGSLGRRLPQGVDKDGMTAAQFKAKDMGAMIRDYGSQFRTPWLVGNRSELREFAAERFFGLERANDLAPYLKLRTFPPLFHPDNITRREQRLTRHIRMAEEIEKPQWTAMTAFLELRPWCATEELAKQLEVAIGSLARGKPHRYAQFVRRKYGVVLLILDHDAGLGLITKNNKITHISRLIQKKSKRELAPQPRESRDGEER